MGKRGGFIGLVAVVVLAASAWAGSATAATDAPLPEPAATYCITGPGGPWTVPPSAVVTFDGVSRSLSSYAAELSISGYGGIIYVGRSIFLSGEVIVALSNMDPGLFLEPGWATYRVTMGACKLAAPPSVTYVAVCKSLPRADGTTGLFQQITVADWNDAKGKYFDAPAANWVDGLGLTCDVPAGYKAAGYKVAWGGKAAPDNDANGKRASGQNDIYPFYVKA